VEGGKGGGLLMGQTNKKESFEGEGSEGDEGMKEVIISDRLLSNKSQYICVPGRPNCANAKM
jgi:hypothetical protein